MAGGCAHILVFKTSRGYLLRRAVLVLGANGKEHATTLGTGGWGSETYITKI